MNNPSGRRRLNSGPLEEFLEGWLLRQERLLDELLASTPPLPPPPQRDREETKEEELMGLVSSVLGHYEEKSRDLHRNVQWWFSPPWCSPLECADASISRRRPS
ncbi:hypothetical protein Nepgr_032475 [Nepenthes gracilis]|uniref:DOG1 domain-containing protein n=1 Tax=Nepenthes gracilis TaxID=150966 RepID=A0AAD3TKX8_NEPGR|nr:hypothetical protein Nepgr_032475 [Nepenthes gracilis]